MANATELMFCVCWALFFGFVIGQITNIKAIVKWFKRRFCIVRCKDCKFHTNDDECVNPHWDCEESVEYPSVYEYDFCSYGEREEE